MQADFQHCIALLRESDHDRYVALLFAPAEHRDALAALFAFNVELARVRELARSPMPGEIRLQWWREALGGQRESEAAAHPIAAALRQTIRRYGLGVDALIDVIDARTFDLYDEPMATLDDLDTYGARTQGTLFHVGGQILGATDEALVRHTGIAYAMAGVLSGLGLHAARRQLYLPLEVLERHKAMAADIYALRPEAELRPALAELRRHARRQLAAAAAELDQAPPALLPALLPVATVGATLTAMERSDYQPFTFTPPSRLRRQWLIWRAARYPSRIFT